MSHVPLGSAPHVGKKDLIVETNHVSLNAAAACLMPTPVERRDIPVCQVACISVDTCVSSWCIHMSECVAVCYNEPCRIYESVMCL